MTARPPAIDVAYDVLDSAEFAAVVKSSPSFTLAAGEQLVAQGEPSDVAYFLISGEVAVYAETPYGTVALANLHAPRLIGEIGALAELPRTASIKAATVATVHRIDREALQYLGQKLPGLLLAIIGQLGRQIDSINKTVGLYSNALSALERREFDPGILDDLRNPPPQLADFTATFRRFAGQILDKRRQEEELASAAVIQRSLLPDPARADPFAPQVDLHAAMRPARDVGGDFYDYFPLDDHRLAFAVGDICGKGLPASLFMAIVVTVLRTAAREEASVGGAIARCNAILCRDNAASLFATAFFGIFDLRTREISYCNCGHNPPVLIAPDGGVRLLPATGIPLGLYPDRPASEASVTLGAGETLLLYTDGVTEALNSDEQEFGDDRLEALASGLSGATSEQVVQRVFEDVEAHAAGAEQADDITCFVLRAATSPPFQRVTAEKGGLASAQPHGRPVDADATRGPSGVP